MVNGEPSGSHCHFNPPVPIAVLSPHGDGFIYDNLRPYTSANETCGRWGARAPEPLSPFRLRSDYVHVKKD